MIQSLLSYHSFILGREFLHHVLPDCAGASCLQTGEDHTGGLWIIIKKAISNEIVSTVFITKLTLQCTLQLATIYECWYILETKWSWNDNGDENGHLTARLNLYHVPM